MIEDFSTSDSHERQFLYFILTRVIGNDSSYIFLMFLFWIFFHELKCFYFIDNKIIVLYSLSIGCSRHFLISGKLSEILGMSNPLYLSFLPEASFGLRVLSSPASVCLSVCPCVCVCVYQSLACPHGNSSGAQARITKFGSEMQNTLRSLLFLGVIDLDLQG